MTSALAIAQGAFGRVALLDMDTPLIGHAHPHCHILLKAGGPDQVFVVGSTPVAMTEEAAVLVNAWEPHRYTPFDTRTRTVFLALYLEPAWLAQLERMFVTCDHPGFFPQPGVSIGPMVRQLRQELIGMLQDERQDARLVGETIFSLAANITHGAATLERANEGAAERRIRDYRIRRAVGMMRDIDAHLGLDEIARASGLSRPRFNQLFRMCTGVSAGVYQASLRLERAVNWLGIERQPVNLVSDALGFSAQSNFTRFFQQHVGVAPSEFRRIAETVTV